MIPRLREEFNRKFSLAKYSQVRELIEQECGCAVDFRLAESPIFLPAEYAARAGRLAEEILLYATSDELQSNASHAIPPEFIVANETAHPNFAAVDFAITGTPGSPDLHLIELQGFPSLFYFQALYGQVVRDLYEMPGHLTGMLYETSNYEEYFDRLAQIILAGEHPENVVLLELDPLQQKTAVDFHLTKKHLGLHICNVRDLIEQDERLYYIKEGQRIQIKRIYNRAIYDELKAKNISLPVDLTKPLDVSWAGHPNWYYRISKALLPALSKKFEAVPNGYLLNELPFDPADVDLETYVLKPLYSFAGSGVVVGPSAQDVKNVPQDQHDKWMLQERVTYAEAFTTPQGHGVKAELRVLMLWPDGEARPSAAHTLVRLTRGKMVGVDFNKGLDWVGSSCALVG
ncbi:MAG TPA: hypothetical protein VFH43_08840 [Candidatus Kapabacteria bacterium]|jgi:hypothetical protein|nr:hypothetical protein [Candidatus Kapabacteria bacterium]